MRIMLFMFKLWWLIVCCCSIESMAQSNLAHSEITGTVEGRVLDSQTGSPIPGANVIAEPEGTGEMGKPMRAIADESGGFQIELPPGQYVLAASKEDANYPDADIAALATEVSELPRVSVREREVLTNVVIKLEKGAVLEGTITDSETRKPLVYAQILLTRDDYPELWTETGPDANGHFRFVLPLPPFRIRVSAPGHQTWYFNKVRPNGQELLWREQRTNSVRGWNNKHY